MAADVSKIIYCTGKNTQNWSGAPINITGDIYFFVLFGSRIYSWASRSRSPPSVIDADDRIHLATSGSVVISSLRESGASS